MRPNDKPEFATEWWNSEKPSEISGAELERAVQAVEQALADERKKSDARSIVACIATFQDLVSTVTGMVEAALTFDDSASGCVRYNNFVNLLNRQVSELERIIMSGTAESLRSQRISQKPLPTISPIVGPIRAQDTHCNV